ncbi:YaiI/YqxD family protein [Alkalihalobacillus sp. AL-G]|uniref:YaiI/YqxD family protein n=1 Tax=Alkalihalobacillus sp. AL-G TaxID=2926399 RepID=UPI00272CDCCC|nr:YaiI/YqxD family protein [Alkalihalobacillus sp. AL-G]WLD92111.1 YaiI/YqxD family protein [Alkalihalobacillus sp. AL-G]
MKNTRNVLVDADACPNQIKKAILEISKSHEYKVFFIASYSHATDRYENIEWVLVDAEPEAVDLYIVNHTFEGNIVITQDHALASLLVSKGVYAISPRGKQYREEEMPSMLQSRHFAKKLRKAGQRTRGPSRFTDHDVKRFCEEFERILSQSDV